MKTTININTNEVDRNGLIFDKSVLEQIAEQVEEIPVYFQDSAHQRFLPVGLVRKFNRISEGLPVDKLSEVLEVEIELDESKESETLRENKSPNQTECTYQILEFVDNDEVREIKKAKLVSISIEPMRWDLSKYEVYPTPTICPRPQDIQKN